MASPKKPEPPTAVPPAPASTYKAYSVRRKAGNWVMLTTTIGVAADGSPTVVDVQSTEPNLRAIAIEQFKLAAFRDWSAQ